MTTATIATITKTMKLLWVQVKELSTKKTTSSNKATKPLSRAKAIEAACTKREQQNKDKHCCWTHGCQVTKDHTSATCKTPVKNTKRQPHMTTTWAAATPVVSELEGPLMRHMKLIVF